MAAPTAGLPYDLPRRLTPTPGKPLHFAANAAGQKIEFRPVSESQERYSVYSTIL